MTRKPAQKNTDLSNLPDDALIRLPDVLRLHPVSKSKWWDGVAKNEYPKPIRLGERARAWRLGDILELNNTAQTKTNAQ